MPTPLLAYVERCLPADTREGRFELARRLGLALELANDGGVLAAPAGITIATIQAWKLHEAHPIHAVREKRAEAMAHVQETLAEAERLDVPRVLTVAGYGREICDEPFEEARRFFRWIAPIARQKRVRVLIEPLSPLRCAALTAPMVLARLFEEIESPDVFAAAIDTGHVLDSGREVEAYLARWPQRVEELQLRGANSQPPALDVPLRRWLKELHQPPAVVCVEHREPITVRDLERLVEHLRGELSA